MRFETKNNLHLFNFEEVTLKEIEYTDKTFTMVLEALIVKGKNPNNEECVDRFAATSNLRFVNASLEKMVKEGYKYYDANGKLLDEKPDEIVPMVAVDGLLKQMQDVALFDVIALKETEGEYIYQLGIDLNEEDTYWLDIKCESTIVEWERFMNRVMS